MQNECKRQTNKKVNTDDITVELSKQSK